MAPTALRSLRAAATRVSSRNAATLALQVRYSVSIDRSRPFEAAQTCSICRSARLQAVRARAFDHSRGIATATASLPSDDAAYKDVVIVGAGPVGLSVACGIVAATRASQSEGVYPSLIVIEGGDLSRLRNWKEQAEAAELKARASPAESGGAAAIPWENRVISLTSENMGWLRGEALCINS